MKGIVLVLVVVVVLITSINVLADPRFLTLPFDGDRTILAGWFYSCPDDDCNSPSCSLQQGIDYDVGHLEPILAAHDGVAMTSQQDPESTYSFGIFVRVKDNNGYETMYAHLDHAIPGIKSYPEDQRWNNNFGEWTPVVRGQIIGYCGDTGTDPGNYHLHFAVQTAYATGEKDPYGVYCTKDHYPGDGLSADYMWTTFPPSHSQPYRCNYVKQDPNVSANLVSGETKTVWVEFRNTGALPWSNDTTSPNYVELKSETGPGTHQNLNSLFFTASWRNAYTPTAVDESTSVGDTARFTFNIKAPIVSKDTTFLAYFQPYNPNSSTWIEDDGDMHFVINVSPTFAQWKTSGNLVNCLGPVDVEGDSFFSLNYDDTGWFNVTLEDENWGCDMCDRFYRGIFNYSESQGIAKFFFKSDDGLWLYINGNLIGHWGGACYSNGCVNEGRCANNTTVPALDVTQYLVPGPNLVAAHVSERSSGERFNLYLQNPAVNFGRWLTSYPPTGQLMPGDTASICLRITNNQATACSIDSIRFSSSGFNIGSSWADFYTGANLGLLGAGVTDSFCAPFVVPSYGHGCIKAGFKSVSCGNQWIDVQLNLDTRQKPHGLSGYDTCSVYIGDAFGLPVILKLIPFLPQGWSYTPFITADTFFAPDTFRISILVPDTAKLGEKGSVKVIGYRNGVEVGSFICEREGSFLRGDANGDRKITVADAVFIVNYLFKGGPSPSPLFAADVNCDGKVTVADVVYLINYLFKGGPAPAC